MQKEVSKRVLIFVGKLSYWCSYLLAYTLLFTLLIRGFEIVDDEGDHMTAICRKMNNICSMLWSCFVTREIACTKITAISLGSKVNKVSCKRRINIKLLYGVRKIVSPLHKLSHIYKLNHI